MNKDFKNKKIAFVTPIYLPANLYGSGMVIKELAEKFTQNGFDVSVITSNALTGRYWYDPMFGKKINKKFEIINGVKIYRLPCNQIISSVCFILVRYLYFLVPDKILNKLKIIYNGPFLIGLEDLLKRHQFDVIHCSPFPLGINKQVAESINKLLKKPKLIFTPFFHPSLPEFHNPLLGKLLNKANSIHTVSYSEKNGIARYFNLDKKKIKVIPLFLNTKQLHSREQLMPDILKFKEKFNLKNRKIILFAGIKGSMKGCIDVLSAVNELYQKDKSYILLAMGLNSPAWEKTKNIVNKGCFLDFGYKIGREKETIFGAADVFCMPSKSESFGLVYLEAWHKIKPVIGANIPAVRELVNDTQGGLLVPYGNTRRLQETIIKLMSDEKLRWKLGANGYRALISKYAFHKVFQKYENLFALN